MPRLALERYRPIEPQMDGFAAFDLLPDLVTVLDSTLTIRYVNAVSESILGYLPEEMVGQSVISVVPETQLADAAEAIAFNLEGKSRQRPAVFSIIAADGSLVPLEAVARPFQGENDEAFVVVVLRPITNRDVSFEERRALEALIAMTAAECVASEADGALRAVEAALERLARTLKTDMVELVVDGEMYLTPQGCRAVGPDLMFPTSTYVAHDDPSTTPDMAATLSRLGLTAICETHLSSGAGLLRASWTGPHLPTGYLYLNQAFGDLLAGTIRRATAVEALSELARTDGLTGVANRNELLASLARRSERGDPTAVLYIDVDRFKSVNDQFGHAIGDALLVACAERLKRAVRSADIVSRLGGDEFAVLATVANADAASDLADRIRRALSEPYRLGDLTLVATASIGVVFGTGPTELTDALANADRAMYRNKQSASAASLSR